MYRYLKHIALFLFNLVWIIQVSTAQPMLTVKPDTVAIRIGEQARITVELKAEGKPQEYSWPHFHDTIVHGIEVLQELKQDTTYEENDRFLLRREFLVTSFDSGTYFFDKLSILDLHSGDSLRVYAEPTYFEVFTLTIEEGAEIADIKPPLTIPFTLREAIPYFLGLLGLIAIALLILYIIARRKKGKPIISVISRPKVPAHIAALEAFEILRKKKLWQEGKVKAYHSELTDILRNYLNGRYGIPAMEMVSHEINDALDDLGELTAAQKEKVNSIFDLADLVKFARWQPLPDENDASLRNATEFVRETIPLSEIQAERNNQNLNKNNPEQQKA